MKKMNADVGAEEIVSSWLTGAPVLAGVANPAGPLYVGGVSTETALAEASDSLYTGCSSCTASFHVYCC